jgi:hypothetical protein
MAQRDVAIVAEELRQRHPLVAGFAVRHAALPNWRAPKSTTTTTTKKSKTKCHARNSLLSSKFLSFHHEEMGEEREREEMFFNLFFPLTVVDKVPRRVFCPGAGLLEERTVGTLERKITLATHRS